MWRSTRLRADLNRYNETPGRNLFTPADLPLGIAGQSYSVQLGANNSVLPLAFTILIGALPTGLSITPHGLISGTPTVSGGFSLLIQCTDTDIPSETVWRTYLLSIAAPTITLNPTSLPPASVGVSYSQSVVASGGIAPYTYAVR